MGATVPYDAAAAEMKRPHLYDEEFKFRRGVRNALLFTAMMVASFTLGWWLFS